MKMRREPKAIAATSSHLYAVSHDGKIYELKTTGSGRPEWEELPELPQMEMKGAQGPGAPKSLETPAH